MRWRRGGVSRTMGSFMTNRERVGAGLWCLEFVTEAVGG